MEELFHKLFFLRKRGVLAVFALGAPIADDTPSNQREIALLQIPFQRRT